MTRPTLASRLILERDTAADLMTPNPISIDAQATVKEAIGFLIDRGFSAAPVIDEAGRPVGVLSRSDILVYDRGKAERAPSTADFYARTDLKARSGEKLPNGFQVEMTDRTRVGDIMTPVVISVSPSDSAMQVVAEMVAMHVHRLFVVDHDGVLVGVITAFDVLRNLRAEGERQKGGVR